MPTTWFIQINVLLFLIFIYGAIWIVLGKDRTDPSERYHPAHELEKPEQP